MTNEELMEIKIQKSPEVVQPQEEVGLPPKRFTTKGLPDALRQLQQTSDTGSRGTTRSTKASEVNLQTGPKELTRS
jgi:hypothetical protein